MSAVLVIGSGVLARGPVTWYQPPLGGPMTRSEIVRTTLLLAVGPAAIAITLAVVGSGHAVLYAYLIVGGVVCAGYLWLAVWFVTTTRRRARANVASAASPHGGYAKPPAGRPTATS